MGWKETLSDRDSRTRWMGTMFALGAFTSLPVPSPARGNPLNAALFATWFAVGFFSWVIWYKPARILLAWVAAVTLSFMTWKMGGEMWPFFILVLWGIWFNRRTARESRGVRLVAVALLCLGSASLAQASPAEGDGEAAPTPSMTKALPPVPKYLTGYRLTDLASCAAVDQIPWKFSRDRRKTRLILRDTLRLSTETQFATWEIDQVMDGDGYVTLVFSKVEGGKRVESLIVKDQVYNRVVLKKGRNKVVEVQDLKTLINRPVIAFNHPDGSAVSFAPGLAGQSTLTLELKQNLGRPLAPVFIHGTFCERPAGDTDAIDTPAVDTSKKASPAGTGAATVPGLR